MNSLKTNKTIPNLNKNLDDKVIEDKMQPTVDTSIFDKYKNKKIDKPEFYTPNIIGTYLTTAKLNLRRGAGLDKGVVTIIPINKEVTC